MKIQHITNIEGFFKVVN